MVDSVDSGVGAADIGSRASDVDTVKISAKPEVTFFIHGDTPDFSDVLDAINPLQQIPIVGTIYREITGESISPASRIAGGALYGGPIGAALGALTSALEYAIGEDPGKAVFAWIEGEVQPHSTTSMLAASAPVEMPPGEAAPIIAVEVGKPEMIGTVSGPTGLAAATQGKSAPAAASTQLASATMIPAAHLRNRVGSFDSGSAVASVATRPVAVPAKTTPVQLAQALPAQTAQGQTAQAQTAQGQLAQSQTNPPKSSRPMTIAEAAAADQTGRVNGFGAAAPATFGGIAATAVPQSAAPVQLQGQPTLNGFGAHSIPAPSAAETNRAAAALSQVSATGVGRTGLPTAGAVTPAMVMVEAKNAAEQQDNAAQQFVNPAAAAAGQTTLRPPRITGVQPRMPMTQSQLPANHTSVDLPRVKQAKAEVPAVGAAAGGGSAGGGSTGGFYNSGSASTNAAPALAPVAPSQSAAAAEESVVVAPATPPANLQEQMSKALDKYDALVKSRSGAGVNASY